jgi:hypothetical protein
MSNQQQAANESAIHYPLGDQLPLIGQSIAVAPGFVGCG